MIFLAILYSSDGSLRCVERVCGVCRECARAVVGHLSHGTVLAARHVTETTFALVHVPTKCSTLNARGRPAPPRGTRAALRPPATKKERCTITTKA